MLSKWVYVTLLVASKLFVAANRRLPGSTVSKMSDTETPVVDPFEGLDDIIENLRKPVSTKFVFETKESN